MDITPRTWLDFGPYGYELLLIQAPKALHVFLGSGVSEAHRELAEKSGLRSIPQSEGMLAAAVTGQSGVDAIVAGLRRRFPLAREREYDSLSDFADRSGSGTGRKMNYLGTNRLGMRVYDDGGRRIAVKGSTQVQEDGANPTLFLRANSPEDMVGCAEGFLRSAIGGETLDMDEGRFLGVVAPDAGAKRLLRPHVGAAFRAAFDGVAAVLGTKSLRDAFGIAVNLQQNTPAGSHASRLGPGLDMALQRAIGFGGGFEEGTFHSGIDQKDLVSIRPQAVATVDDPTIADRSVVDLRSTTDVAAATRWLDNRRADARTTFLVSVDAEDDGVSEADRFRLASEYDFTQDIVLDGDMCPGGAPMRVLSVGARRPRVLAEAVAPVRRDVSSWAECWTIASEMSLSGISVSNEVGVEGVVEGSASEYALYKPASASGRPTKFVPRALQAAHEQALVDLRTAVGDVDAFVASELRFDVAELSEMLDPEQIDGVALGMRAFNRGRAMLLGDGAGVGKGREQAALMRWHVLNGRTVIFGTEAPKNFSDMYRDIRAIRSEDILAPLILNANVSLVDPVTNEVMLRSDDELVSRLVEHREMPSENKVIFFSYGMTNRDSTNAAVPVDGKPYDLALVKPVDRNIVAKSLWLRDVVDKGAVVALDEVHNAAGNSNITMNCRPLVDRAQGIVFSSATHAADEDNLPFFSALFPSSVSSDDLRVMARQGGAPFKEVVTDMLVRDGVMVRREIDPTAMEFRMIFDEVRYPRNRAMMDRLAPILADLIELGSSVDRYASIANGRRGASAKDDFFLTRRGIGTPLNHISRIFITALRVDAVVEDCVDILDKGLGKPLIYVDNTMQTLFDDVAATHDDSTPATLTMRHLLRKALDRTVVLNGAGNGEEAIDVTGIEPELSATSLALSVAGLKTTDREEKRQAIASAASAHASAIERIRAVHARVQAAIEDFPHLSLAFADDIRDGIEAAGYSFVEMTGRTIGIEDGRFVRKPAIDAVAAKNDYNAGIHDVAVIGRGMTTGLDFHSSRTFADQRRRFLYEMLNSTDVRKRSQTPGRASRNDQVVAPCRVGVSTGLPSETLIQAVENAHLRSMSALTSGNRDNPLLNTGIPDLVNSVGDIVCTRYAEAHPDLMRRLGFEPRMVQSRAERNLKADEAETGALEDKLAGRVQTTEARRTKRAEAAEAKSKDVALVPVTYGKRTATEILGRLSMLPVAEQIRVSDEIVAEFEAVVQELEAKGETPLRPRQLDGVVHEQARRPFLGVPTTDADSVFSDPVYAVDGALKRSKGWISSAQLVELVGIGSMATGRREDCVARVRRNLHEILQSYVPPGISGVEEAIKRGVPAVVDRRDRLTRLADVVSGLEPGNAIRFTYDGDERSGIVTQILYPRRGREHIVAAYGVEYVVPGDEKPSRSSMETFLRDPGFSYAPGLVGATSLEVALRDFDREASNRLSKVTILNGNVFEAVRLNAVHRIGSLSVYWRADGTVERGLVLGGKGKTFDMLPVEMTQSRMSMDLLSNGEHALTGSSDLRDKSLRIETNPRGFLLRFPARSGRYSAFWGIPQAEELFVDRRCVPDGKSRAIAMTVEETRRLLDSCHQAGVRLYAPPMSRQWSLDWLMADMRETPGVEEPRVAAPVAA